MRSIDPKSSRTFIIYICKTFVIVVLSHRGQKCQPEESRSRMTKKEWQHNAGYKVSFFIQIDGNSSIWALQNRWCARRSANEGTIETLAVYRRSKRIEKIQYNRFVTDLVDSSLELNIPQSLRTCHVLEALCIWKPECAMLKPNWFLLSCTSIVLFANVRLLSSMPSMKFWGTAFSLRFSWIWLCAERSARKPVPGRIF